MKKVTMTFLGVAFAVIAAQASAVHIGPAAVDLGVIPAPLAGNFEVVTFDNLILNDSGDPAGTTFIDTYSFTIEAPITTTDISVIRLPLDQAGASLLLFDQFRVTLHNGGDFVLFDNDGMSGDLTLLPDTYEIQVTGRAVGDVGGLYVGAIAVSVVPIPAAGLLFFSGIAALGLVRSKRASA